MGHHEGAIFYTIGQRHGLYISGNVGEVNNGLPYYVVKKDLDRNIVYVSKDLNNSLVWVDEIKLKDVLVRTEHVTFRAASLAPVFTGHRFADASQGASGRLSSAAASGIPQSKCSVRLRHLGQLIPATLKGDTLYFEQKIKKPASGQSAVFYDGEICLGGGIII